MTELKISERQVGPVTVLDLSGNITIGAGGKELSGAIRGLVEQGRDRILLNLSKVVYVDSCGLGNMVSGYNRVRRAGGQIKLLNLTAGVRDVMTITKLVTVFDVFEEESAALKSYY